MEVTAKLRYYRQSPRKVRLVTKAISGLSTKEAFEQLQFIPKRASRPVTKLLQSAIANAVNNFSLKNDNLYIKSITVDSGPTLKRWRPRAFGKASMIRKKTSHIIVILDEKIPSDQLAKDKKDTVQKPTDAKPDDVKVVKSLDEVKEEQKESTTDSTSPSTDNEQKGTRTGKKGFMPKVFQRKAG